MRPLLLPLCLSLSHRHPRPCSQPMVQSVTEGTMVLHAPAVALNANRHVSGVLRGFDQFMNIVLDNAVDEKNKTDIGMVVSAPPVLHTPVHQDSKMSRPTPHAIRLHVGCDGCGCRC